ncbi:reverse transcriptase [Mycena venus]|uniref:Reverse transcriptase n=1 Tax=Mycena venus TaxID=2733690 RepID=A0A8H6Z4N7_9AGAR|nr:reverse transcriptase [Mycena venus]
MPRSAGLKAVLSTRPRAGQFRTILYDKLVRAALAHLPSLRITNLWTPVHIGTIGNEFANDAAKAATRLQPPPSVPVSLTTCMRQVALWILERWTSLWKVSTTGRGLREVDHSPSSLILRSSYNSSAARVDINVIFQLRTDFSALNAHRFRCRLTPSPACESCGAPSETRVHFLLHCPTYEHLHPPLQAASYKADILGAVDVPSLLNNPKLLKAVITFVNQSRCFR